MKEFNWDKFINFNNKIAVHCKTEKETKDFCKCMDDQGIVWVTKYDKYCENTCYTGLGICINYNSCEDYGYKILEWSDYMKKEFTKADLKDGMVVEWRIGDRFLLLGDRFITYDGFEKLKGYDNDLNHVNCNKDYDIVKVFVAKHNSVKTIKNLFDDKNLELIWKRTEPKKMTAEEMRQKLEELTGEKIEVEPSREQMVGAIKIYCDNCTSCDKYCCIEKYCRDKEVSFGKCDKETIKKCYKKMIKDE